MTRGGLAELAEKLNESIQLHAKLSVEGSTVLVALQNKIAELNKKLAPIHERATALTWAEENITLAKATTDELLSHIDTPRKVRHSLSGPHYVPLPCPWQAGYSTRGHPSQSLNAPLSPRTCQFQGPLLPALQVEPILRQGPGPARLDAAGVPAAGSSGQLSAPSFSIYDAYSYGSALQPSFGAGGPSGGAPGGPSQLEVFLSAVAALEDSLVYLEEHAAELEAAQQVGA